jgi:hypothetical protein
LFNIIVFFFVCSINGGEGGSKYRVGKTFFITISEIYFTDRIIFGRRLSIPVGCCAGGDNKDYT